MLFSLTIQASWDFFLSVFDQNSNPSRYSLNLSSFYSAILIVSFIRLENLLFTSFKDQRLLHSIYLWYKMLFATYQYATIPSKDWRACLSVPCARVSPRCKVLTHGIAPTEKVATNFDLFLPENVIHYWSALCRTASAFRQTMSISQKNDLLLRESSTDDVHTQRCSERSAFWAYDWADFASMKCISELCVGCFRRSIDLLICFITRQWSMNRSMKSTYSISELLRLIDAYFRSPRRACWTNKLVDQHWEVRQSLQDEKYSAAPIVCWCLELAPVDLRCFQLNVHHCLEE